MFEKGALERVFRPKRDKRIGGLKKLCNEELHNLYSSSNTITMIKSRRMRRTGYVSSIGEMRNAYRVLVRKPEAKKPLGRSRRRWEDNINMNLRELGWDGIHWIRLS
jgi:hypothetical protein